MEFKREQIDIAVVYLVFGSIATGVLANQPNETLHVIGRGFHLLNIISCALIVSTLRWNAAVGYVVGVGLLYLLDRFSGIRLPYVIALNGLFLLAGMTAISRSRELVTTTLSLIVIASGAVMVLQVAGVGEWTQILTTHGTVANGEDFSKVPSPALFVGYYDTLANFVQGRPAGLFYSNQFASLLILVALALAMTGSQPRLVEVLLCVTAVLSLSKVVFLGIVLLCGIFFLVDRERMKRLALYTTISLVVYALLFPGLFFVFFASPQTVWVSAVVRMVDIGVAIFGWDSESIMSFVQLLNFKWSMASTELIQRIVDDASSKTSWSLAYAAIVLVLLITAVAGLIVLTSRPEIRTWLSQNIATHWAAPWTVLACFCLAANFFGAQIFWLCAGFASPMPNLRQEASPGS